MPSNGQLLSSGRERKRNPFSSTHRMSQDSHPWFISNHNPPISTSLEIWSPQWGNVRPSILSQATSLMFTGDESRRRQRSCWLRLDPHMPVLTLGEPAYVTWHVKNVPVLALTSLIVSFLFFPWEPHLLFGCVYNQCLWKKKRSPRRD